MEMTLQNEYVFHGFRVRVLMVDGQPHWIAADVCRILEIGNPSDAIARLDDDESTLVSIEGGPPAGANVVTESGLYSLILGSRKPQAKAFKRWITHDVLPAIRRKGFYAVQGEKAPDFMDHEQTLVFALEQVRENKLLKAENKALAVTASAHEVLTSSVGSCHVADVAKVLGYGEFKFFAQLRKDGILQSTFAHKNIPYQEYIDQGYFIVKDRTFRAGDETRISKTTFVTPKGESWLAKKYGNKAAVSQRTDTPAS
jgi:prophage antirepressor-like protein